MSVDTTSKSLSNLAASRARPVSVPVHKLADDPAFLKLVSCNTLHVVFCITMMMIMMMMRICIHMPSQGCKYKGSGVVTLNISSFLALAVYDSGVLQQMLLKVTLSVKLQVSE